MSKEKRRIITLIILSLALCILYFLPPAKKLVGKKPQPVLKFSPKEVKKITLVFSKNKIQTLEKKEERWVVKTERGEFPADYERVNSLVNTLSNITKEEIVSKNKNRHKKFGIGEKRIEITTTNTSFTLYVGNSTGYQKYYARIDNENEVFIVNNLQLYPEDLRDLKIPLVKKEEKVTRVILSYSNKKLLIEKNKNSWLVNSKRAEKTKVDFFVNDLATLKAKDIENQSKNLHQPLMEIYVNENGKEKFLKIFSLNNSYYAKSSESSFIYQLEKYQFDSLKKTEEDFLSK